MGRFIGKMAVGGRLLDDVVGGSIEHEHPEVARLSGLVAVSHAAEGLVRSDVGPIHLIAEGGPTLRVDLGRSRAVGELYVLFEFVGVVDEAGIPPIFSIRSYPDLRGPVRPTEASPTERGDDGDCPGPVLLRFEPIGPDRPRRACS